VGAAETEGVDDGAADSDGAIEVTYEGAMEGVLDG